jgi:flagellin
MGLRISTNVASLAAQRQLGHSEARIEHASRALASGSRIVSAGDDAAGFAISEGLRSQASGLQQAKSNSENAKGLIQVAEGGLNEQNNILIRLRELAIQSASDTVSDEERGYLNTEYTQLTKENDRIAKTTSFGKKNLLQGENQDYEFHLGTQNTEQDIIRYKLDANTTSSALGIDGLTISDRDDAKSNLGDIDNALSKISKTRAGFGAIQSRLEIASNNLDLQHENVVAARSRIVDADVGHEASELAQGQILKEFGIAVLAQANQNPAKALKLL